MARTLAWFLGFLALPTVAVAEPLTLKDPKGDDRGWGKLSYPTGAEYTRGAFDLVGVAIREDGDDVVFEIELAADLTDPWKSKDWGGNGFSLQFVQVYLDLDGKKRSGEKKGVPGSWVEFGPDQYWDKVVLISPQPNSKVEGEVAAKAPYLKNKVVLPSRTEARKRTIVARVPASALGGKPDKSWGVQVLMLSNEGFPAKEDILARKVNEIEGEHRFGGGCDGFGDPQVTDLLAGPAQGADAEGPAQEKLLSGYTCADEPKGAKLVQLPFVRL